jgi:hypothetical protein
MNPSKPTKNRPVKEKFYVRVPMENGPVLFCDATAYIGKEMPFSKPQATCSMRVDTDAVYFALLHVTRKMAADFAARPIKIPRGPVQKMQRTLADLDIETPDVWVEVDLGEDGGVLLHRYHITRDENSVGRLEVVDGFGGGADKNDDVTFDLPTRALELRLYLRSPRLGRTIAVNFIGHVGKPRTPETVGRAAAMVLNSMSGLAEFRHLAGVEAMKVPAPPAKWAARPAPRRDEERVSFTLQMRLLNEAFDPVGAGDLQVEIDLESINQATGRFLFHATPPAHLEELFNESYRGVIVDFALAEALRRELGSESEMIAYEIMLGEVSAGTVDRLREAAGRVTGVDATPSQYQVHGATGTEVESAVSA